MEMEKGKLSVNYTCCDPVHLVSSVAQLVKRWPSGPSSIPA